MIHVGIWAIFHLVLVGGVIRSSPSEAVVAGRIRDAKTGETIPATVAIRTSGGSVLLENPGFDAGFRCAGVFEKRLPSGKTTITVSRGFDYAAIQREFDLRPASRLELDFELARRTPLRSQGWVAGDNHVHMIHGEKRHLVDFDYVALAGRAEGLDYMSLAQAWSLDQSSPETLEAACRRVRAPDFLLTWNMEAPKNYYRGDVSKCLGHGWTLGMRGSSGRVTNAIRELMRLSAWDYEVDKTPVPNFEIHALIHALGGIVSYTHPCRWWWGRWGGRGGYPVEESKFVSNLAQELPYDTLIGPTYDTIDILMQPHERAANERAQRLWFLLLNHGYRIPATASSDATFDNPGRGVPGKARVYTRLDGELTLPRLAEAMKSGRNFVTSGPLLSLQIGERQVGDVIRVNGPARFPVRIRAWASGEVGEYLTRIDVLRCGDVVRSFSVPALRTEYEVNFEITESNTGWYIARAAGSTPGQIAITNPVYFEASDYRAPEPALARVAARVVDRGSGKPLDGVCDVVKMEGADPLAVSSHPFREGKLRLEIPGSMRLIARVPGYEPMTKSVLLDFPPLASMILNMRSSELTDWSTFEHLRRLLAAVELEFRLAPVPAARPGQNR